MDLLAKNILISLTQVGEVVEHVHVIVQSSSHPVKSADCLDSNLVLST